MTRNSIICARTVMCCALMLVSAVVPSDLKASTECQVPLVLHSDHWEPPAVSEAELLAARILQREGRLFPADEAARRGLTRDIEAVLSRIRDKYQEMAEIVARETPETPRGVILELEPDLLDAVDRVVGNASTPVPLRTGNVEFDCLNALLGLRAVDAFPFFDTVVFHFEHPIDFMESVARYSTIEGVGYVEPNALLGDGPDIGMRRSQQDWYVVFRDASGDCPSGCVYEELHFFVVKGGEVERVVPARALEMPEFSVIVVERGWRPPASAAVPGAPRRVRAERVDRQVRVSWEAPADDGGVPILVYEYRSRPEDGAFGEWRSAGLYTSATVYGLESLSYVVEVRAVNAVGAGAAARLESKPASGLEATSLAWLARFGRTVSVQMVEAVEERLRSPPGTRFALGGHSLDGSGRGTGAELPSSQDGLNREWSGRKEETRGLTERELLLGTAFRVSAGHAEEGSARWATWGRASASRFDGRVSDAVSVDGDVVTVTLGADVERGRWLAGVALSHGRGDGASEGTGRDGELESTLTSVHPYLRYRLSEQVSAWGTVGRGEGRQRLAMWGQAPVETDLEMTMGAAGVRSRLSSPSGARGLDAAVRSEALWMQLESGADRAPGGALRLAPIDAWVSRLRLALEGTRPFELGPGRTLAPSGEVAIRHDGGDAETGSGLEVGAGIRYVDVGRRLTMQGRVRRLLAHEADGFEAWEASGSLRVDPRSSGRGLSLTLAPSWGAASSRAEQLWSRQAGVAAGDRDFAGRLDAELGYALRGPGPRGFLVPYTGLRVSEGGRRAWRAGGRWQVAPNVTVSLEGERRELGRDIPSRHAITLRATARW